VARISEFNNNNNSKIQAEILYKMDNKDNKWIKSNNNLLAFNLI
jgi:hypothetical protein